MKVTAITLTLAVLLGGLTLEAGAADKPREAGVAVDLVICLDTSNSMDGLIESAKLKLWAAVNELAAARPRPRLRVGLYQYGNDGLSAENGWVQQICPLTDDLDKVYGKLFELRTNGGTEYVARVMRAACEEIKWSTEKNAMKVMFIAGNEAATQDTEFKLQDICKATATKGIVVNTIFCGDEQSGRQTGWSDAAAWADGRYAAIDQDSGTVVVKTKYDDDLAKLGGELNGTYIAFGADGQRGMANQAAQDTNAGKLNSSAAAERASAKSTALYVNAGWDLVDATREGKIKLDKVKTSDLPKEMQSMTPQQRKEHLEKLQAKRSAIQKRIRELSDKRDAEVKKEMAAKGLSEKDSFDHALRAAVREQGQKAGLKFESPTTRPVK